MKFPWPHEVDEREVIGIWNQFINRSRELPNSDQEKAFLSRLVLLSPPFDRRELFERRKQVDIAIESLRDGLVEEGVSDNFLTMLLKCVRPEGLNLQKDCHACLQKFNSSAELAIHQCGRS